MWLHLLFCVFVLISFILIFFPCASYKKKSSSEDSTPKEQPPADPKDKTDSVTAQLSPPPPPGAQVTSDEGNLWSLNETKSNSAKEKPQNVETAKEDDDKNVRSVTMREPPPSTISQFPSSQVQLVQKTGETPDQTDRN